MRQVCGVSTAGPSRVIGHIAGVLWIQCWVQVAILTSAPVLRLFTLRRKEGSCPINIDEAGGFYLSANSPFAQGWL